MPDRRAPDSPDPGTARDAVVGVEARVREHCARHALLPEGRPVLALLSGGPDSTCLVDLLLRIHDGPLHALVVDHGLRPESEGECARAASLATEIGVPVTVERVEVPAGGSLQDRARRARWDVAARVADRVGAAVIATGHTADDQTETVLFRIARGTGRTGALGMAAHDGRVVRPLLCLRAPETRAWCRVRGLPAVTDPSNRDRRFARARVRQDVMPALAGVHPGAAGHVADFAEILRDEAELVEPVVSAAWERCAEGLGLHARRLAEEPPAAQRLLVRRLLEQAGAPGGARARRAVEHVLSLVDSGAAVTLPGGAVARLDAGVLSVRAEAPAPEPAPLPVPGRVEFDAAVLTAARGRAEAPSPDCVAVIVDGPLEVRPPRPGDRLPIPGGGGRHRVGRLLAAAGVATSERARVPVVTSGERVVWVAGHRADPTALARPGAEAVVLELVRR